LDERERTTVSRRADEDDSAAERFEALRAASKGSLKTTRGVLAAPSV
jgi:hypothetical protein